MFEGEGGSAHLSGAAAARAAPSFRMKAGHKQPFQKRASGTWPYSYIYMYLHVGFQVCCGPWCLATLAPGFNANKKRRLALPGLGTRA